MRVISRKKLVDFWERPDNGRAKVLLEAWHAHVKQRSIVWNDFGDVRETFGSASKVHQCVVFNIGGNNFRLITIVLYSSHKVLIRGIYTHSEYDEGKWKTDCGCLKRSSANDRKKGLPKETKAGTRRRLPRSI